MAWSGWVGWNNTSGKAPYTEGSNNSGWNHAQVRYRTDSGPGWWKIQYQVRSMRGCGTPCFSGGSCYYESGIHQEQTLSGASMSGGGGVAATTFWVSCPVNGCTGDQGTWKISADKTVTISKAAGGSGTFKAYTTVGYGMVDFNISVGFTIPAGTATLAVSGSNVKFDVYVGSTKVGSQVSSYSASQTIGASYTVKNITANSGYRLASSTSSSYTGTVASGGTTVTIPAAVKTYSFSWSCTNCTGDTYLGTTKKANDSSSNSFTFDTGSSLYTKDIKAKAGYFFSDSNTTTKSDLSATNRTSNLSWSYTATACVVPSGGSASVVSRTWNSVTAKASVTSFGTPSAQSGRYVRVGVGPSTMTAYSSNWTYGSTSNATATGNKTLTNTNLVGCQAFKVAWYANNGGACSKNVSNSGVNSTTYYLPPHPLASASVTSTSNDTDISVTVKAKGAAADGVSNITGAKVNYQYRYSINGGTTWKQGWTTFATAVAPNTEKSVTFNEDYNTTVTIQVRQVNNSDTSQASEVKTVTLAAVHPKPKAPIIQNTVWDQLNRTFTCQIVYNGSYGQPGAASFDHFVYEMSYNSDYSSPFYTATSYNSTWNIPTSYMKPNKPFYIRAKCINNWGEVSVWDSHSLRVKRPIWGVAKKNGVQVNVIDILQVDTGGNFSQRDWIESTNTGKNRIIKKV